MKVAVVGCTHGELDAIYDKLKQLEEKDNVKVDLLLCCGDFESIRNKADLRCKACPEKYREMGSFHRYYSGEKLAPVLTVFIGGNHEASNYLQELPYGGWVAPNIWYMGLAGVVSIAGIKIAGLSGIYKQQDYYKVHFERPPYTEDTKRSVYHYRILEILKLKQIQNVDIMMSHDWPRGIYYHGDINKLMEEKPRFQVQLERNTLGTIPAEELLYSIRPSHWFAAHMHVKFEATVPHPRSDNAGEEEQRVTKFLALDKCLPEREFLQIVDIPHCNEEPMQLSYNAEWLAVLCSTNHLPIKIDFSSDYTVPQASIAPTTQDIAAIKAKFDNDLRIPYNFVQTAPVYDPTNDSEDKIHSSEYYVVNPQTTAFCHKLKIDDPITRV